MPAVELPAAVSRPRGLISGLRRSGGGNLLLAGCMDTQYSWDTSFRGRPNGAFTYYALKTLRENKPINYVAWFNAIRAYLPTTHLPQDPQGRLGHGATFQGTGITHTRSRMDRCDAVPAARKANRQQEGKRNDPQIPHSRQRTNRNRIAARQ